MRWRSPSKQKYSGSIDSVGWRRPGRQPANSGHSLPRRESPVTGHSLAPSRAIEAYACAHVYTMTIALRLRKFARHDFRAPVAGGTDADFLPLALDSSGFWRHTTNVAPQVYSHLPVF